MIAAVCHAVATSPWPEVVKFVAVALVVGVLGYALLRWGDS